MFLGDTDLISAKSHCHIITLNCSYCKFFSVKVENSSFGCKNRSPRVEYKIKLALCTAPIHLQICFSSLYPSRPPSLLLQVRQRRGFVVLWVRSSHLGPSAGLWSRSDPGRRSSWWLWLIVLCPWASLASLASHQFLSLFAALGVLQKVPGFGSLDPARSLLLPAGGAGLTVRMTRLRELG